MSMSSQLRSVALRPEQLRAMHAKRGRSKGPERLSDIKMPEFKLSDIKVPKTSLSDMSGPGRLADVDIDVPRMSDEIR